MGALSHFNANPGQAHWKQVHVFKYLAGTKDLSLCYGPGQDGTSLQLYSDADYAGDVDSARSASGHTVFIGKCLVNWSSKQQPVVAKSTTEAEYIAANEAGSDGVWFRNFTSELGYPPMGATPLWLDNQSAIRVGKCSSGRLVEAVNSNQRHPGWCRLSLMMVRAILRFVANLDGVDLVL